MSREQQLIELAQYAIQEMVILECDPKDILSLTTEITRLRAEHQRKDASYDWLMERYQALGTTAREELEAAEAEASRLRAGLAASKDMIARLERTIDVETYTKLHREMYGADPKLNETDPTP